MELLYKCCYGLTTICGIGLGLFVLCKNPRSRLNVIWAITSFTVAIFSSSWVAYTFQPDYGRALLAGRICNYAAVFIPVFFTHFCLALLNKPLKQSRLGIAGYVFAIGMAGFFLTPWFIPSVSPKLIFRHYINPGPLYVVFTLLFFTLVIYSQWLLLRHLHKQPSERQNQIKYVVVATIIGFLCGSTTFLLVYDIPINPLPSLFIFVYAVFITYAIVRHHLMDITVVIRKSLVYSLLIACITATYLVMVIVMEKWFQGFFGYRSLFATAFVAFLIAVSFNPLRNWIQTAVDRALFKGTPAELAAQREQLLTEIRKTDQMKAVATLAAGLAHEIKNPLASIKTFTAYLPSKHRDPSFVKRFERIVGQELDKIQTIIINLLTFAKPEALKREPLAVDELLQETIALLNGDCVRRQVKMEICCDRNLRVLGDRTRLKQVLLNLCLNGLEAMEDGGRLRLSATSHNSNVMLTVEDTGKGIGRQDLSHVFDPFFTTKEHGTGLGLSVVNGIIKEHAGSVQIETQSGKGTTVSVLLPSAT